MQLRFLEPAFCSAASESTPTVTDYEFQISKRGSATA